nr:MAG TPA: hypothetical protein [Caudoviricetes sp.]DAR26356.1 MAG TPA: hypothetical protein [Caudoviricetes sp.]DAS41887.1 MAG TPA: hypothetical protein [Caudoviricetes sp.]
MYDYTGQVNKRAILIPELTGIKKIKEKIYVGMVTNNS